MYNIVKYPHIAMVVIMNHMPLNIFFQRALAGDKLTAWNKLVAKIIRSFLTGGTSSLGTFIMMVISQYSLCISIR